MNENIDVNFASEVQWPEARCFYAYQEHNECVHGETYSLLIDKFKKMMLRKASCSMRSKLSLASKIRPNGL